MSDNGKGLKETEGTILWDDPPESLRDMSGVKLAWAMPVYGPIPAKVYQNHMATIAYTSRFMKVHEIGEIPTVGVTDKMYLHSASNTIVRDFLKSDCTHLMWTEMDMLLPYWAAVGLLNHDKDIASGVYFLRNGNGQPCLYTKGEEMVQTNVHSAHPVSIFPEDSLFKIHCPGMGCVLFKREVFENIEAPWFDLREGWDKTMNKVYGYGQDIYFYSKVAKAGFDVWVDSSIHCAQVQERITSIHEYRKMIREPGFKANGFIIGEPEGEGTVSKAEVPSW